MLIKMKSGIEGFVWWLSIVHRSLLRFLFDLEILKPQPVPSLPIHSKCALLQRPRHPILQPCSILWGVGTSSFISFAGTWSAHTLAHTNNDLVAPVTERCFSAGMDSRGSGPELMASGGSTQAHRRLMLFPERIHEEVNIRITGQWWSCRKLAVPPEGGKLVKAREKAMLVDLKFASSWTWSQGTD